jgi:hypothetical protein
MESQAIKEYDDFAGQDGYVIVDGLDDQTPGGKKLLSEIVGDKLPPVGSDQHRNQVLTVNSSDTVVWSNAQKGMTYEERTLNKSIISGGIAPEQHVNNNSVVKIQFDERVTDEDIGQSQYLVIIVYIDKESENEATNFILEVAGQDVKVHIMLYNYYGTDEENIPITQRIDWVYPHFITIDGTEHPEFFDKERYIQVRVFGNVADGYTHVDAAPTPSSGS